MRWSLCNYYLHKNTWSVLNGIVRPPNTWRQIAPASIFFLHTTASCLTALFFCRKTIHSFSKFGWLRKGSCFLWLIFISGALLFWQSPFFNWRQEFYNNEKQIFLWINFHQPALHTLVQKNKLEYTSKHDRCVYNFFFLLYFFEFLCSFLAPWQSLIFCATWHPLFFPFIWITGILFVSYFLNHLCSSRRYSIFFNFFSKFFSCLQKTLFLSCYWFRSKPPIHDLKFWISVSKSKLSLMSNTQDSSSVTPMLSIFFQLAQTTSARLETGAIILANSRKIKALLFCHQFCHLSSSFDFSLKLHKRWF